MQLTAYIKVSDLQPQLAAYLGAQARIRDFAPIPGEQMLLVEASGIPTMDAKVYPMTDETPGIHCMVQGGTVEVHGGDTAQLNKIGSKILRSLGAKVADQPQVSLGKVDQVDALTDRQARRANTGRGGCLAVSGNGLLSVQISPAAAAVQAANAVEKALPDLALVNLQHSGPQGTLVISGDNYALNQVHPLLEQQYAVATG